MRRLIQQFTRFFIVGALSAGLQFSILIACVEFFALNPVWASTCGYLAGALMNYWLNHYFAFKSRVPHRQAVLRFTINSCFGLILNLLLMHYLLHYFNYVISQIISSAFILVWNFTLHRYWTFK